MDLIESLDQPIVLDRFHIGEKVYGKIFRGYDFNEVELDERLHSMGAKHLFVTAEERVLINRLNKRGDWYVNQSDIGVILDSYEKELWHSQLDLHVFDTSEEITEEDFARLLKFIYD